jgi:ectoine hydroxylase-related dioxygenase (phytanoyl-CoA dioxygenase family)
VLSRSGDPLPQERLLTDDSTCVKTYDNNGKLISETNTIYTKQGVVTTNTVYYNDRVMSQHISIRDNQGKVTSETVLGGKLIP